MTIRLKSLELHGYKTFANKTLFEFTEAITAIVGPNGSGKSNIADCMRWVLGEQSFSLLRAKKTEDMIFSGSENRPRAGMASATIVFDNTDGWLPIEFSEVAITRKAYRDGQNEYLINGQRVRLRDVNELLANSGLAERTYTIIGQGLVDAALSLRAEERRKLFEEAAGIGLYRSRREEALRRLEITHRNLERVQDILGELEPRLRSLERQMRRVKEYQQVQADLQVLLKEWYGFHWYRAQTELALAQKEAASFLQKLEHARKSRLALEQEISAKQERLTQLRQALLDASRRLMEATSEESRLSHRMHLLESQMQATQQRANEIQAELFTNEEETAVQQQRLQQIIARSKELEEELREARIQLDQAQAELETYQGLGEELQQKLQDQARKLEGYEAQQAHLEAQKRASQESLSVLDRRLHAEKAHLQEIIEQQRALQSKYEEFHVQKEQAKQLHLEATRAHDEIQERLEAFQNELDALLEEKRSVEDKVQQAELQVELVEKSLEERRVFRKGAKFLQSSMNAQEGAKISHMLHEILSMPKDVEKAIIAALDEDLEALLWQDEPLRALELMAQQGVQGILIPLKNLRVPEILDGRFLRKAGVYGLAAHLVSVPEEWRDVIRLLLGRVVVVEDRKTALRIIPDLPIDARAVTLDGEVFSGIGRIKVGASWTAEGARSIAAEIERVERLQGEIKKHREQMYKLEEEIRNKAARIKVEEGLIRKAQNKVEGLWKSILEQEANLSSLERQLALLESEKGASQRLVNQLEEDFASQNAHLQETEQRLGEIEVEKRSLVENGITSISPVDPQRRDELAEFVGHWKTEIALGEQALSQWESQKQETQLTLEKLLHAREGLISRLKESQEHLSAWSLEVELYKEKLPNAKAQIEQVRQEISMLEEQIRSHEIEFNTLSEREVLERNAVSLAEHNYAQARVVLARHQEHLNSLMKQVEDDLGLVEFEYMEKVSGPEPLPLNGMVESLPLRERLDPALEGQIKGLKVQLRRIGPVNLEAEKEYEEVLARYQFLNQQVEDLRKAEADVRQVIRDLDEVMQKEFVETFSAVSEEFSKVFHKLFSGGSARLFLTNEEDPNQAGIEIEARLPGKRAQGLALLSGGERSLTAVALIFALLKVSPTPFCILDEVDAMLDEFNVQRFGDVLRELSQKTQFILITHNRYTVQIADILYGVTMGHDSTSQVLSLKMDEVERYVQ